MFLFRKHKQTVERLRRMRESRARKEAENGDVLSRARSLARWGATDDSRTVQLSHWFPERFSVEMYNPG